MNKDKTSSPVRFILYYTSHYQHRLVIGIIFIFLTTSLQVLTPWLLKYVVDYIAVISGKEATTSTLITGYITSLTGFKTPSMILLGYAAIIIIATVFQGIFRFLMRYIIIGSSREIEYDIRNDYYLHLQKLTASFYQRYRLGDLMARATNDLNAIRSLFGPGIMYVINTFFLFVITFLFMFSINKSLSIWALFIVPITIVMVYTLVSKIQVLFNDIQQQFSHLTSTAEESINGIRVIKSYSREERIIDKFNDESRYLVDKNIKLARIRAMLRSVIQLTTGFGILVILWVGGEKIIQNQLTIGDLVAFFAYLAMLTWPMIALGWVLNVWQQGLASLKRVMEIMAEKPEFSDDASTDNNIRHINGEIEFKNVSFSYHADEPLVLDNLSFKVDAGTTVAIVGPTGAGKTTLVNLIPRLYEIRQGQILIDGKDIRTIPLQVLRQNIGFVPQESFLFSETLNENIKLGVEDVGPGILDDVLEISQLSSDMDQFSDGLETVVGERGITLSGGQKQRSSIARAVIKKPPIVVLDDSLSAVDTYTEEKILEGLHRVMETCTAIIVSHRISTIMNADVIYVLKDGKFVEKGSHDELLNQQGLYYQLYQRQMLESSLEEL